MDHFVRKGFSHGFTSLLNIPNPLSSGQAYSIATVPCHQFLLFFNATLHCTVAGMIQPHCPATLSKEPIQIQILHRCVFFLFQIIYMSPKLSRLQNKGRFQDDLSFSIQLEKGEGLWEWTDLIKIGCYQVF